MLETSMSNFYFLMRSQIMIYPLMKLRSNLLSRTSNPRTCVSNCSNDIEFSISGCTSIY